MAGRRVHVVMDEGLVGRIDRALVGESRGEFVRRAVERALGEAKPLPTSSGDREASLPAPAEQLEEAMKLDRPGALVPEPRRRPLAPRRHSPTCSCGVCKP